MTTPESTASPTSTALLPATALRGQRIGLSVGDSEDLPRLGLTLLHQHLVLRELARTVLLGGGTLAYGGHLRRGGFTVFLMQELTQYANTGVLDAATDVPLLLCLAQSVHRTNTLAELDAAEEQLGVYGELRCLDLDGQPLADRTAGRGADAEPKAEPEVAARALTALRRHMVGATSARLVIGGRRSGYGGTLPGVVEEALLSLRAGQPLYLASGLGGSALDMAATLEARCAALCAGGAPAALPGLDELSALANGRGLAALDNGLSADENLHLALTHRPAEVAALVALGLGRWAQQRA